MPNYLENKAFLSGLVANLPNALLITDENRKLIIINQQFCEMFSLSESPEELIGKTGFEILEKLKDKLVDFETQKNEINEVAGNKESVFDKEMQLLNGRIVKRDYVPIKHDDIFLGHIWLFKDETEKIIAQQEVRKQKEFYEGILNNLPADIAVFSPEHKYLFLNPVAVKDPELRKWMIDKTDIDYCILKGKDLSMAERRRSIYNKVIQTRKNVEWEETIINREGKEEFHLRKMSPVYDKKGELKMLIGYGIDITEVKKIQQQITLSEKRYRDLFSYSQAIICTHDMQGNLLTVNPSLCEVLEYDESEVVGRNLKDFLPEEDKIIFDEIYLQNIPVTRKLKGLFRVITKSGRRAYLLYQNYCVEEENNAEPYVIAFSQDVTDRIKMEKELKAAKKVTEETAKAKERFLANMSHEIRTPMNGIIGITDLLLKTKLSEEQETYLKIIEDSAQNLLNIINDILDLEKISAGHISLELLPVNINARLNSIIQFFQYTAKQKSLDLVLKNNLPKHLTVLADPTRIRQIFNNLISNAIKFTHTGTITVNANIKQETEKTIELHFSVEDSGIGIERDKLLQIFQPFTQAYPETSRIYGGTGLGLAITKNLIELQKGSIWVESEHGSGSTFHFTVEYEKTADVEEASDTFNYDITGRPLTGLKVLIAEDNEVNQFLIRNILEQWGMQVFIAANGQKAVDLVKQNEFALILMDIQMPVLNGLDATRNIRQMDDPKKSKTPVIALTANALKGEELRYFEVGMNDFLIKPFKEHELFNIVQKVLNLNLNKIQTEKNLNHPNMNTPSSSQEPEKLYDLKLIYDMAKGNEEFIQELIHIFVDTIPPVAQEMKQAFHENNGELLSELAHKLKSTIDTLCISSIQEDIRTIEKTAKTTNDISSLKDLVEKVDVTLKKVSATLQPDKY